MSKHEWGSDALGDRMKAYEDQYRFKLAPRSFVVVRLDGKAFHSFTRGFDRPWDRYLIIAMDATCRILCEQMGGAVFGYVQSDEISILMAPGAKLTSEPWFGNGLQKIVSVSASICTATFNALIHGHPATADKTAANFDSRAFVLPDDEVVNYFIWRQQDATRNSIQMLARTHFSHSECNNKNVNDLQDMLMSKGVNWNRELTRFKRGSACKKVYREIPVPPEWRKSTDKDTVIRGQFQIDDETPIFTQDREYITSTWLAREES